MAVSVDLAKLNVQIQTSEIAAGVSRLDDFATSADRAETSVARLSRSSAGLEKAASRLKTALAGMGLGLSFSAAMRSAADFESSIVNLAKVSDRPLEQMRAQIMGLDSSLGSYTELAQGYYQVMSAGVTDATASMEMLTASSMAAKAAQVTQADSIRALTSLMTGFSGQLKNAADASDLLFSIERYGKTSVQELVPVVGDLASTARIAKVSANDMAAAFSIITQTAGSTPVAATQMRSLFMNIANPSEVMQKTLKGMGTNATDFFSSNSLMEALKKLQAEAQKTGRTIGALFTDREAKVAAENLMSSADKYGEALAGIEARTGATSSAFGRYTQSINGQIAEMSGNMSNLATQIGTTFGGAANGALQSFNSVLREVTGNFSSYVPILASVAAGFGAVAVARKSAGAAFAVGDDGQRVAGLRAYIAAQYQNIAATREQRAAEAKLAMERARDELTRYKRSAGGVVNQTIMQRSPAVRVGYIEGLRDLQTELTTKTNAYQTSLKGLRTASLAAGAGMSTLKSAGSAVLGVFGGPLGLAFTGAAAAAAYLSSKQSLAEQATDLQTRALQNLHAVMREAKDGMLEFAEVNQQVAQAKLTLAIQDQEEALRKFGNSLKLMDFGSATGFLPSFREQAQAVDALIEQARAGNGAWTSVQTAMSALITELDKAGESGSRLGLRLRAGLSEVDKAVEGERNLGRMNASMERVSSASYLVEMALRKTTEAMREMGVTGASTTSRMAGLAQMLQDSSFSAFAAGLDGAQKSFAQAMKGTLNESQLSAYFSGDMGKLSEKDAGALRDNATQLDAIYANYKKIYTLQEAAKHAGSTTGAREAIQRVREEIERLNQVQPTGVIKLTQTLREIGENGKKAGMDDSAVKALKAEYAAAFKADQVRQSAEAMRDYRREIAGLTGDAQAVRRLEMEAALDQWAKKFRDLGESAEESAPKLARMREALEHSQRTKDTQTSVQFYKEWAELSGELTYSLQAQSELIALQAEEYRNNGIPDHLVSQWEALKRLQASNSGWDGARRAMLAYYSEASNAGRNFETFFTNSFSTLEDALVGFVQTGKFSFSDMVNSMLADLARLAVRQNILGPLAQGLSGLFAGFGGMGAGTAGSGAATAIQNANFGFGSSLALGGGFHGGGTVGRTAPAFLREVPAAAYAEAPRFHRGYPGFGPDEYPAILQSGERVLNREETAAYNAGRYASGGQGNIVFSPVINPVVIDKSGQNLDVQANVSPNGNGGFDLEVYIARAADAGIAKMAASNKSRLVQYLDQSRALGGNARSLY